MHKFQLKNVLVFLFLSLFSLSVIAAENDAQQVVNAYHGWCSAIGNAKGDPALVTKFYAPDAILMPTLSSKVLVNRGGGLDAYFKGLTSHPNLQCTPEKLITKVKNNIAVNSGTYVFSFTDKDGKTVKIPARFTFVYKKVGDQWLIIKHHSSQMPE